MGGVGVVVVQRQVVRADVGGDGDGFGIGIEGHGETADNVVFGLLQLGLGGAFGNEVGQDGAGGGQRVFGTVFFGGEGDAERAFARHRAEAAGYAVHQPFFVAQFFHQAAVESAAAEDVVADDECVAVGVLAHNQRQPHDDGGLLFTVERDVLAAAGVVGDFGDFGAGGGLRGQAFQYGGRRFFGLTAVDVADDGDVGVVFGVVAAVELRQVFKRDAVDALFAAARAVGIGMAAVVEQGYGAAGEKTGIAEALLQRGQCLPFGAVEDGGIEFRMGDNLIGQFEAV